MWYLAQCIRRWRQQWFPAYRLAMWSEQSWQHILYRQCVVDMHALPAEWSVNTAMRRQHIAMTRPRGGLR